MTIISLLGVAIAVFALVATLAVRTGFRIEFVSTLLGANAHTTIHSQVVREDSGRISRRITDYDGLTQRLSEVEGVVHAAPQMRARILASSELGTTGVELFGMGLSDIRSLPLIGNPETSQGNLDDLGSGLAIGNGVARTLGVTVGDEVRLIAPEGAKTPFGVMPRVNTYVIAYVFEVGRYDIDSVRAYLPFNEAQVFLDREGAADEVIVFVEDPELIEVVEPALIAAAGDQYFSWTWKNSSSALLNALRMEDNLMIIVMSILVLIATSNIVSGLVMLVKNKGSSIGILRSVGLSRGSIMRVFFLYGASIGVTGTAIGIALGCLFAIYIDPLFAVVNAIAGGNVWDPQIRFLATIPAVIKIEDIVLAAGLALLLSFLVTLIPARRAASMSPAEAIRYE